MLYCHRSRAAGVMVALLTITVCAGLVACNDNSGSQKSAQTAAAGGSSPPTKTAAGSTFDSGDLHIAHWSAVTRKSWPPGNLADNASLDSDMQRTNVVVVLDMSGSMARGNCSGDHYSKAQAARAALKRWTQSVPSDVNLGLIAFSANRIERLVPLGTGNRSRFGEAARGVQPGGGTPLRAALAAARKLLAKRALHQLGYGRYQIVLITDGAYSRGQNPLPVVQDILSNPANPIEIHTIGFCIKNSVLRQPGFVQYQSANDPEQLAQGLSSVLAESTSFQPVENFNEQ